jgi:hypothetical protein
VESRHRAARLVCDWHARRVGCPCLLNGVGNQFHGHRGGGGCSRHRRVRGSWRGRWSQRPGVEAVRRVPGRDTAPHRRHGQADGGRVQADVMRVQRAGRREPDEAELAGYLSPLRLIAGWPSCSRGHTSSGRNHWKIQSTSVRFGSWRTVVPPPPARELCCKPVPRMASPAMRRDQDVREGVWHAIARM